ncbi:uncharacterized protein Z520_00972 [Fonsecaea multimorphosa CBS 102226]|uniref:Transcription factor domain-containing protein n=1 Tax=Fonsecaea multimorphosa CBS 102226 TaxID=1442371 RepID=A0A0D2IZL5_9EURO|nr:uncharacterized protein Z520_00972 [Fonsecaea multimorphosa CBS 102226]KIY02507.1 hypothetical protein Z520_00972 [Fonsecaea multimorphosa CBS 102226]OAL31374.1 hypothetical protein AYO22_00966 [Fonsecaea multimorphosa]
MKAPKFMFINKTADSDSLSHSHKSERIKIHSHVQKGRRYKKSEGGIIYAAQLPPLRSEPRDGQMNDSQDDPDHEKGYNDGSSTQNTSDLVHYQSESPVNGQSDHALQPLDPNIDPLLWDYSLPRLKLSGSPESIPIFPASAEENFDPFEVTCVRVDEAIYSLLHYFLQVWHPNVWHLERNGRADHQYAFRHDAMSLIQGCLHDEYNMYALLAYMASYMQDIDGLPAPGDGAVYMHRALRASQNYVKSRHPITGRLIFNIFALGCAEWYRYNREAAYVHLKAVKSVIDSIGGLKSQDGPLVDLLLTGDAYVAGELERKPLWSDSDFDNGDDHPMTAYGLQELQKLLSGAVAIGSGLLSSAQQNIIPATLRWIILDLAVLLSVYRSSQSLGSAAEDQLSALEGLHWINVRSIAIRHRLLHLDLADERSAAIRTAIVMWMFLCFTVTGRVRSAKVMAPLLRDRVSSVSEKDWEGHEEVLLWVLSIGALSAQVGSETHTWFVARMSSLPVINSGAAEADRTFAALVTLAEKFFYLESAQKNDFRALADDVHDMLQTSMGESKSASTSPKGSKR